MKYIGAHVSISGGVSTAPERAESIGANALGIFTKNQRQWKSPPLADEEIQAFKKNLSAVSIKPEHVIVHDSYLINIGNPDSEKRKISIAALLDEALRVEQLGLTYLNFHPGSGLKAISEDETLKFVAEGINHVLQKSKNAVLLIEATAGQGAHIGYRFEHLARIIADVEAKDRIGVCIDTCHIFAAGYDIRTEREYKKTITDFKSSVGLQYLYAIHLNDAKSDLGSRVDRHDSIGEGNLGLRAFEYMMKDKRLDEIPFILETPKPDMWKAEIKQLRAMSK